MGIQPFDPNALDAMRSSGYALKDALCELIDNSIWHGQSKNIEIKCSWLDKTSKTSRMNLKEIIVADDGNGMSPEVLALSVQIGKGTSIDTLENFGRFGYGMIAGALTQCRLVEIYSKQENGDWNYIQYPFDKISKGELIMEPIIKNPPNKISSVIKNKGTIIIWSIFDLAEPFNDDWNAYTEGGRRKGDLGSLSYELGRIYRKLIGEEIVTSQNNKTVVIKNKNIRTITINGTKINPVDPLYMTKIPGFEKDPKPHHVYDELILEVDTHHSDKVRTGKEKDEIHIRLVILNEEWRKLNESNINPFQKELYPRYIQWNEGISVLRNGREVSFDDYPKVWSERGTWDRFWGCEIDFPTSLDKRFTIKNVKIGIKCDKDLFEQIKKPLGPAIQAAIRVIRHDFKSTRSKAEKIAYEGPHGAAEERFKDTDTGTKVSGDIISAEEKEKAQKALAARFSTHDEQLDHEKFGEIGVQFKDDIKMYENGPFLEVKNNLGNNIVIYNLQHPFFIHLDEIYNKLESLSDVETVEKLLGHELTEEQHEVRKEWKLQVANTRYLIDLLLGSFAAAKGDLEPDVKQVVSSTLNSLVSRWTDNLFTVTNDKNFAKRVKDEI